MGGPKAVGLEHSHCEEGVGEKGSLEKGWLWKHVAAPQHPQEFLEEMEPSPSQRLRLGGRETRSISCYRFRLGLRRSFF